MIPTIVQPLTWSENGWTRPYKRVAGDQTLGSYVDDELWGAEDWMFATGNTQLVNGKLYTYAQADPSKARVKAAKGVFNLVFVTQRPDQEVVLVGAYLGARYVGDDDRKRRWKELDQAGVVAARIGELKAAFGKVSGPVAAFRRDKPLRWVVARKDVLTFPTRPRFARQDWLRPNDPYFFEKLALEDQAFVSGLLAGKIPQIPDPDLDAEGFPPEVGTPKEAKEGRKLKRSHVFRERNTALREAARACNLTLGPPQFYTCEACDETLQESHGDFAIHGFDVHHQVPLAEAGHSGTVNSVDDLCVLCVQCHRLAHRSGRFTVKKLRAFHAKMRGST